MWCYQRPGFKSLLIAELRRQQESSQYCDVLLQAKGASVSAHSCVLSVVSPLLSSSLSSMPPFPAGATQPVEFQDLEAQTLRHMVELLYSGEMAGEGEWERQQAISMAAMLGIDGLVEVRRSDRKQRPQGEVGHCMDVAVQTFVTEVEAAVQTSVTVVDATVQTSATEVEVAVQTSATEVAVQTSATEVAVQTSATEVEAVVQTSTMEVAVQTSAMEVEAAVQTSTMEVAVQTSAMEVEVAVQTSATEVAGQTSATEVAVQTSAMEVEAAVQTSATDVAVQTSATEVEVAVQTEPEEREGGCTRWRREMRDGVTLLWKETESSGGQDTWTQTEELPIMTAPPPPPPPLHPPASLQTIDINSLQTLGQTNPQLLPISIVYNENQWAHTSSAPSVPVEDSTQCVGASTPFSLFYSGHGAPYGAEPHAGLTALQAAEEMDQGHFEQFQGDIPGFISHFLDPEKEGGPRGRRARRKRGAAVGGAMRAGTAGRRPRGAPRGRGRGLLTQTVDVQEVSAAGRLQTLYLQHLGGRLCRSGQGGGAAGRKLRLKTREMLSSSTAQQKKRVRSKVWQLDQTGDLRLCGGGRGRGRGQRGRKNAAAQAGSSAGRTQRSRNQLSSPEPSSQPPVCVYDVNSLPAAGAALHCSASPALRPGAASFLSPAASLLHTCPLPPAASLPHDEQPEHIDRLLEEVMMGLDILPKSSSTACPPPGGGGGGGTLTHNQQQSLSSDRRGSSQEVGGAAGGEVCVLQQVSEGAVNKILDQFLQSYEQYVNSEEKQAAGESGAEAAQPHAVLSKYKRSLSPRVQNAGAPLPVRRPQAPKEKSGRTQASSSQPGGATTPKHGSTRARRRPKQFPLSLEKKRLKLKMAVTIQDVSVDVSSRAEKQLQQIPVVKLRRSPFMPVSVSLRDLKAEDPARMEVLPAVKNSKDLLPEEYLQFADRKVYPIRSRLKRKSLNESCSFIDKPLKAVKKERPLRADQPHRRPGKNPINTDGGLKVSQGSNVQPQKEAGKPGRRRKKRRKSSQGPGEDVTAAKKVCLGQPSREDHRARPESQPATEEPDGVGDVRTRPLGAAGRPQEDQRGTAQRPVAADGGEKESRSPEGRTSPGRSVHTKPGASPWRPAREQDEDVDVIGGSSPAPHPVTISWTDSSEEEEQEEDVDVVGEK